MRWSPSRKRLRCLRTGSRAAIWNGCPRIPGSTRINTSIRGCEAKSTCSASARTDSPAARARTSTSDRGTCSCHCSCHPRRDAATDPRLPRIHADRNPRRCRDHRNRGGHCGHCLRWQRRRLGATRGPAIRQRTRTREGASEMARRNARRLRRRKRLAILAASRRHQPLASLIGGRCARRACGALRHGGQPSFVCGTSIARGRDRAVARLRPQRTFRVRADRQDRTHRSRRRSAEPRHDADRYRCAMIRSRGFTLVEILVALAIIAVALSAGMRALAQSTDSATALKARTLALWVAQNRLASAQVATPWPALGTYKGNATQAGAPFLWRGTVTTTPNPAFRKIEIDVMEPDRPDYHVAHLVGFIGNSQPQ